MFFNPIVLLALAVIAGLLGFMLLDDMQSWLVLLPSLFFLTAFFASLALPAPRARVARSRAGSKDPVKTETSARQNRMMNHAPAHRPTSPTFPRLEKLTSHSLRSHSRSPVGVSAAEGKATRNFPN